MATTPSGLVVNEGWEERVIQLNHPSSFYVSIDMSETLKRELSPIERQRMGIKLSLVQGEARLMALGMLKGTLKYPTDAHTVEEYELEEAAEQADVTNYRLLRRAAPSLR